MSLVAALETNQQPDARGFYEYAHEGTRVLLADEGKARAAEAGWTLAVPAVRESLAIALTEPGGGHSIDAQRNDEEEHVHTVHKLTRDAEALLAMPIAVKGRLIPRQRTGEGDTWHADLEDQFARMQRLATAQQTAHPEGVGGHVFMCRPLAYVACNGAMGAQKWLFMERVQYGETVETITVRNAHGEKRPGFTAVDYPELAALIQRQPSRGGRISFEDLAFALSRQLGGPAIGRDLGDLNGKNIIMQTLPDGNAAT